MKTISILAGFVLLAMTSGNVNAKTTSTDNSEKNNLIPVTRTIAKANGLNSTMGIYIVNAIGVSDKAQLALHSGDIILAVNGRNVSRPVEVTPVKIAKEPGDIVSYKIWRDRKVHILNLRKSSDLNIEKSDQFEVIYDEVPFLTGSIRCVVTKPKGIQKAPAILLVQSGTSGQVCNVPEDNMYRQLTDNLTKKGYVTMRVERVGVGENMDQMNSNTTDIFVETLAFEKALRQLKKYDFVDSTKTFLFGHCTGGKISPLLASRNDVKGVIVYGSCLNPASEYLNNMLWTKLMNSEKDLFHAAEKMQECQLVIKGIVVNKMKPTDFADANPELIPVMRKMFDWKGDDNFMGRNAIYMQSVERMESWVYLRHMNTNLLAIRGTADTEITESNLVKEMVDASNYYRPGKASMVELQKTDHNFAKVGSLQKSYELQKSPDYSIFAPIAFDNEVVNTVDNWITQINS
jgi:dienelactone hydrolase